MTVVAGNNPSRKNTQNTSITNRVIGVLIDCGPITPVNKVLVYNIDDFSPGSANTTTETIRQYCE